jgi:hypothetical protein
MSKRKRFIKIISFRIRLDNFILTMVLSFLLGGAVGVAGMYYGVKFERDRYKASLYFADKKIVDKAEKGVVAGKDKMVKIGFR